MGVKPARADTDARALPAADVSSGLTLNVELVAWTLVVTIAAGWRLLNLGDAIPGTAEALRARMAWEFAQGSVPAGWTGDIGTAVGALWVKGGREQLGWLRLAPALFGLGCVAALALFRPYAGRAVPLLGGLLLAISPLAVAGSRAVTSDSAGLLCGLVLLWLVIRVSEDGDVRVMPLLGATAGAALLTSAIAPALALVAAAWVAVEVFWCDRQDVRGHWRSVFSDRRLLVQALIPAVPALALAVFRFGAGVERLTIPAFADWSSASSGAGAAIPWHASLTWLAAYEPLTFILGVAGAITILDRWERGGTVAVSPFERLLVVWAGLGLLMSLGALHARPGQALVVALPCLLLAANLTVRTLPDIAKLRPVTTGLPLLPVGVIAVFLLLRSLEWADQRTIPHQDAVAALALIGVCVALGVLALYQSPAAARAAALVLGAWLALGWVDIHGAAAVSRRGGNEMLTGERPVAERTALVRIIEDRAASGSDVAVDRDLAAALAWELRGRDLRLFTGLPPASDTLVVLAAASATAGYEAVTGAIGVEERWYPSEWNTAGVLRWLVYREAWGPVDRVTGQVLQRTAGAR